MMPLHNMPKIIKMVRIHRQAKEVDEDHMNALRNEVSIYMYTIYNLALY